MNQITRKKKKAFTLIELIIVLAIMAIIAAIAIPNFIAVRDNSKIKADNESCATIQRSVLMLVTDETILAGTKVFDVTVVSGVATPVAETSTTAGANDITNLEGALKGINGPQGKTTEGATASKYKISIDANGGVAVVTM